jgi:hypothetical protein
MNPGMIAMKTRFFVLAVSAVVLAAPFSGAAQAGRLTNLLKSSVFHNAGLAKRSILGNGHLLKEALLGNASGAQLIRRSINGNGRLLSESLRGNSNLLKCALRPGCGN